MDKIEELLTRGVEKIYPTKEALEKILRTEKKLRVYQGFDPTSPYLHIGHLIGLIKLRQWQDLGHEVIFLVGDFTGMVGDPTGKDNTRIVLTKEQVLHNAKNYKKQASKILRFDGQNPVKIKYNSEWLAKLSALELAELTKHLSYQQVVERDMFQRRIKNNMDIALSEFLYPFMQGYDSVAMDVDVEIGGTDQTFNMLMGRKLMRNLKKKEKFVMTTHLLADSNGTKIGKTEGNVIALIDNPEELYAKIMSLGDEIIVKGLECLTRIPVQEIAKVQFALKKAKNPLIYKKMLAYEIVKELDGEEPAKKAQKEFEKIVQNKELPEEIETLEISVNDGIKTYDEVLVEKRLVSSKLEAKRLMEQGGITLNNKKIINPNFLFKTSSGAILKIGKRKILKLKHV